MKYFLNTNVLEAAKKRIRFIFKEFDDVVVWVSGGKDSTVIFNISLEIARELNRLPLKVAFIDQESEWKFTIDMMRKIMYHKDVTPYWYHGNHKYWVMGLDYEKNQIINRARKELSYR